MRSFHSSLCMLGILQAGYTELGVHVFTPQTSSLLSASSVRNTHTYALAICHASGCLLSTVHRPESTHPRDVRRSPVQRQLELGCHGQVSSPAGNSRDSRFSRQGYSPGHPFLFIVSGGRRGKTFVVSDVCLRISPSPVFVRNRRIPSI